MSNPILNISDLQKEFRGQKIDPIKRLKLKIWFKASELAALGGPSYNTATIGHSLKSLITNLGGQSAVPIDSLVGFDGDMVDALDCSTDYLNAVSAGANVTAANNTNSINVESLQTYGVEDLEKMDLCLKILLGRHANYPQ